MDKLADCQKAFTSRCPNRARIKELRAREGRGLSGVLTYYNPKYWEQAQKFCNGCEEFEPIRGHTHKAVEADILKSELSSNL